MKFSKEEILKILEGAKDEQGNVPFAIVKKAIEKLKVELEWIPVTEKLPEEGRYLVWMPFAPSKNRITVTEYCGYWNIKTPISAWMPLPKPYRAESENK